MDTKELQKLIAIWFEEDIRDGDIHRSAASQRQRWDANS